MSSTQQLNPLYGRKYELKVVLPNKNVVVTAADSNFGANPLRVTFDVSTIAFAQVWWADITIWNPDAELIDPILTEQAQGATVFLSAGYQNGNYGLIWSGPVFQAFLERENVTDLKLTLHCILRLPPLVDSALAGETIAALQTQNQIVQRIAQLASVPLAKVSANIKANPTPRAQVIFGNMERHLDCIAGQNNMQWWLDQHGLNMGSIQEDLATTSAAPPLSFSPAAVTGAAGPPAPVSAATPSIVGTPQQTMYGVSFKVLLDPRVQVQRPLQTVSIDNSLIQFLKRTYGQYLRLLDQSGVYVVVGARYVGDTRGNEWYTEIQGVTRTGNVLAELVAGIENASVARGTN